MHEQIVLLPLLLLLLLLLRRLLVQRVCASQLARMHVGRHGAHAGARHKTHAR